MEGRGRRAPRPRALTPCACLWLQDYLDWAEQRGDWDESKRRLPSRVVPGLARLAKGLACTVLWMWLVRTYNADLLESEAWAGLGLGRKAVLIWIVGVTCRMKYYSVWAIAESSLIFNGLCLEGYDAQVGWGGRVGWGATGQVLLQTWCWAVIWLACVRRATQSGPGTSTPGCAAWS